MDNTHLMQASNIITAHLPLKHRGALSVLMLKKYNVRNIIDCSKQIQLPIFEKYCMNTE